MSVNSSKVTAFAQAVVNRITGLISTHNGSSSAHSSLFNSKQDTLVSGTSIKTINNHSLLGAGNISIQGGDGVSLACVSNFYVDTTTDELILEVCTGKLVDSVSKSTSGLVDTYTITFSDESTYVFTVTNGADGANGTNGRGITNIAKTGTSGLVDTYTITYSDNTTSTFTVTNGQDGSSAGVDIVTSTNGWNTTTSDSKVPSEKLTKATLDAKVDTVSGKGLSTNDFTNTYKGNLDDLVDNTKTTKNGHVHGNLTSDGKVGSNANYFVYTTTSGAVTDRKSVV